MWMWLWAGVGEGMVGAVGGFKLVKVQGLVEERLRARRSVRSWSGCSGRVLRKESGRTKDECPGAAGGL